MVIIGAGGVGLMGVTLARKMGAKDVIIVDIDAGKRDAAIKAGATKAVDGGAADAVQQIQNATGGGAWAVIDFVGSGATVNLAVNSIIKGGTHRGGRPLRRRHHGADAVPAAARHDACAAPMSAARATWPSFSTW